jgi:dUTP pyrophosphatase
LKIKLLHPGAKVPQYKSAGASGVDLECMTGFSIPPGGRATVGTGIAVEIEEGSEGQVRGRSGLARDWGVVAVPGTIDSDYRGEIGVTLINLGTSPFTAVAGSRIAQLVICPCYAPDYQVVEELSETVRGAGGFGSTGVK